MPAQYILRKSTNNQYHFALTADNNEKILMSEQYSSKEGAMRGIQSAKTNSSIEARYARLTSTNGEFYFLLKGANGEAIGTSETYKTQPARENGIEAVMRVGPNAPIHEQA